MDKDSKMNYPEGLWDGYTVNEPNQYNGETVTTTAKVTGDAEQTFFNPVTLTSVILISLILFGIIFKKMTRTKKQD